ncbi:MAG: oligosaccharide flippase family protein, partial [Marinoscillum sp.]
MVNRKSYWISAGKLTLLQRGAMLFFGVLNFFLLVRMMDMKSYGVWMLFMSVTTLLHMTREGFFKKPLIRFINKLNEEERAVLQGTSLSLNIIFSLTSSLILVLISGFLVRIWDAPGLVGLFAIYFFTNLAMAYFSHYNNVLEANFRFSGPMVANILKSGVLFVSIVIFYLSGRQIDVIFLGFCDLGATLAATGCMYLYSRNLVKYKVLFDKQKSLK